MPWFNNLGINSDAYKPIGANSILQQYDYYAIHDLYLGYGKKNINDLSLAQVVDGDVLDPFLVLRFNPWFQPQVDLLTEAINRCTIADRYRENTYDVITPKVRLIHKEFIYYTLTSEPAYASNDGNPFLTAPGDLDPTFDYSKAIDPISLSYVNPPPAPGSLTYPVKFSPIGTCRFLGIGIADYTYIGSGNVRLVGTFTRWNGDVTNYDYIITESFMQYLDPFLQYTNDPYFSNIIILNAAAGMKNEVYESF